MTEQMGLQMFPENRYWRCRRDAQRQSGYRTNNIMKHMMIVKWLIVKCFTGDVNMLVRLQKTVTRTQ